MNYLWKNSPFYIDVPEHKIEDDSDDKQQQTESPKIIQLSKPPGSLFFYYLFIFIYLFLFFLLSKFSGSELESTDNHSCSWYENWINNTNNFGLFFVFLVA